MKKLTAILIVNLGLGFASIQMAGATGIYDAFSSFYIRVDEATDVDISVAGGTSVFLETFDDASAGGRGTFSVNDAVVFDISSSTPFHDSDIFDLVSGDTAEWTSSSFGVATNGDAFSEVLVNAFIDLDSFFGGSASISWEYSIDALTDVDDLFTESAEAFALVDFFDPFDQEVDFVFDEVFSSETGEYSFLASGTWDIDYSDGGFNSIEGFVDSYGLAYGVPGSAPAPVPEPATMLLFGAGLAGYASSRLRRKK